MIVLLIFATLLSATGFAALMGSTTQVDQAAIRSVVKSSNFEVYRNAVEVYARANPAFLGVVPDASLSLPSYHVRDSGITNYVTASQVFVYTVSASAQKSLNAVSGSAFSICGIKSSTGIVTPGLGVVSAAMPSVIPDGAYTSMTTK